MRIIGETWGSTCTEQVSALHGWSQQPAPIEKLDTWPINFKYWKSHSLGFIVVAEGVKTSMPMARKMLRLVCRDSAFLVVASTRLIICLVMLSWIIVPVF